MAKVLLVIASKNFRDEEYARPKEILEGEGIEVKTASSRLGTISGKLGMEATADLLLGQVNIDDFDGIVFVGGPGAMEYFESETALNLARQAYAKKKIVAAICIAPSILANAGILKGKNATAFPSEIDNLKNKGANYTGESVTIDGNIITANGPEAAEEFGKRIAEGLVV
uniref:DJ-1/PfpI family protein n=1 Tax=candidate division CPR3 bacterium TaxID=2268181 RepID=A0A7V3JA10_UNCC3